jgi:hypothetical protein
MREVLSSSDPLQEQPPDVEDLLREDVHRLIQAVPDEYVTHPNMRVARKSGRGGWRVLLGMIMHDDELKAGLIDAREKDNEAFQSLVDHLEAHIAQLEQKQTEDQTYFQSGWYTRRGQQIETLKAYKEELEDLATG